MTVVRMANGMGLAAYQGVQIPAITFVPTALDGATYREITWAPAGGGIPQTEDVWEFDGGVDAQHIQFGWTPDDKWNRGALRFKIHWARGTYVPGTPSPPDTPEPSVQEDVVWRVDLYLEGDREPCGGIAFSTVRRGDLHYAEGVMHITSSSDALIPSGTAELGKRVQLRVTRDVTEENAELLNQSVYVCDLHVQYKESAARVAAWS